MIGPSRDMISNTFNNMFNEKMTEKFTWGYTDNYWGGDTIYISEQCKNKVTRFTFSNLKNVWKQALGEDLEIDLDEYKITDDTIVCLATGD